MLYNEWQIIITSFGISLVLLIMMNSWHCDNKYHSKEIPFSLM